jgi:FlaA1/EpsC-like NDP-sugar epimerase
LKFIKEENMQLASIRKISMLLIDALLINMAVYCALLLRFDGDIPLQYTHAYFHLMPVLTSVNLLFLLAFKLYNRMWNYASINEFFAILSAVTCGSIVNIAVIELFHLPRLPRSIYVLGWIGVTMFIGASRLWWRILRDYRLKSSRVCKRVLIVGAGDAGALLVREIQRNPHLGLEAIAFADDEPSKMVRIMMGIPVMGNRSEIPNLVENLEIDEIIIAMPSVGGRVIRGIVDICKQTPASLFSLGRFDPQRRIGLTLSATSGMRSCGMHVKQRARPASCITSHLWQPVKQPARPPPRCRLASAFGSAAVPLPHLP